MVKIVVIFFNPRANELALAWKKSLLQKIEEAIENVTNEVDGQKIQIFKSKDFAVNVESS